MAKRRIPEGVVVTDPVFGRDTARNHVLTNNEMIARAQRILQNSGGRHSSMLNRIINERQDGNRRIEEAIEGRRTQQRKMYNLTRRKSNGGKGG